jgi:phage/plasmid-associated DNA primase
MKKSCDSLLNESSFDTIVKILVGENLKKTSIKNFIQEDRYYFANGSFNFITGELEPYDENNMFIVKSEVDYVKPENCTKV